MTWPVFPANSNPLTDEDAIKRFGLPAAPEHREVILAAFAAEMEREVDEEGDYDLIKCLVIQLFSIGQVEDSLLIWKTKAGNFDFMCGLDVQFLCGAGIEATREFLHASKSQDAHEALRYLQECIDAGDFEGWTVKEWLGYYRRYYRLDS